MPAPGATGDAGRGEGHGLADDRRARRLDAGGGVVVDDCGSASWPWPFVFRPDAVAVLPSGDRPYMSSIVRRTLKWLIVVASVPGTNSRGSPLTIVVTPAAKLWARSPSSPVTISRLLCALAHCR